MKSTNSNENSYSAEMLKELLRIKISNEINRIENPKCLYINKNILNIINFIFDLQFAHKGMRGNIYTLDYDRELKDIDKANNVIFFIYPEPHMI